MLTKEQAKQLLENWDAVKAIAEGGSAEVKPSLNGSWFSADQDSAATLWMWPCRPKPEQKCRALTPHEATTRMTNHTIVRHRGAMQEDYEILAVYVDAVLMRRVGESSGMAVELTALAGEWVYADTGKPVAVEID